MTEFSRGSEWRQWDLHFHTPSSYDYKDMSVSNQDIVDGLISNNISVVAITDHHLIDVERIKELKKLSVGKNLTILPGIEFLSDARGAEPIHFIAIFSENCNVDFIWGQLKNNTELKKIEGENRKPFEVYCDLSDTIKLIKELNGIVTIHAGSKHNGIENITHSLPHSLAQKEDIASIIDVFELGKTEDIEGYMSMVNPYLQSKLKKWLPVILCSDNHNIRDYIRKSELWIKADPTFEGLKQIIYEPLDRVSISDRKPDEKRVYDVIDYVKFLDPSFTTNPIKFNENLTSIIGGKSTGKSILIKSIAKTADLAEYEKRNLSASIIEKRPVKGFEVFWKDGQVSVLDSGKNPGKRIIYIPQSYLNRVVDDNEKTSDIDEIIQDVLIQKEEFKNWFNSLGARKKTIADQVEMAIKNLFDNIDLNIRKNKEKKELGDEDGIKKQIEKLQKDIIELQGKSQVSPEDLSRFNSVTESIKSSRAEIELLNKDISKLNSSMEIYVDTNDSTLQNIINQELRENVLNISDKKKLEYRADWKTTITKIVSVLSIQINSKNQEILRLESSISDLRVALVGQQALNDLMKSKEAEEKLLTTIKELIVEIKNSFDQIGNNVNLLANLNAEYYSLYLEAKSNVDLSGFDEELSFDIVTTFRKEKFQDSYVNKCFDGRTTRTKEYEYLTTYNFENVELHKTHLNEEAWRIIYNKTPRREGVNQKEAVNALFQNWFMHDYKVTYQNDNISEMSPGKKSFVLLRLLVDLDDSLCPILIDQPEDDLDNRSIYNQVVNFIRKRKKVRQIIIVTHNPNLVLGSDAEEIIVANQEGEDTKNKTFTFEYISGSIENTKVEDISIEEVLQSRGIQEHICDVLEGGREAFDKRKKKYNF